MSSRIMQQANTNYMQLQPTMPRTASSNPVNSNAGISKRSTRTAGTRNDHDIRQYLRDVPLPPRVYEFSEQQQQQQQRDVQAHFFKDKKDQQLPDFPLNLYNASIIAMCKCNIIPYQRRN